MIIAVIHGCMTSIESECKPVPIGHPIEAIFEKGISHFSLGIEVSRD
jgi:hypothetical protein